MTTQIEDIELAKIALESGEVIGFPTETVYGLAACMNQEKAIEKVYQLKNRPKTSPLIVHIKGVEDLGLVATNITDIALKLAETFWPGPLTLLLPKTDSVSDIVTSGKEKVAVRVPNHPVALALLNKLSSPVVAPSANPFGRISPTKAVHVIEYFGDSLVLTLDGGDCDSGLESTIVGFESNELVVYRLGGVTLEQLQKFSNNIRLENFKEKSPEAPGMSLRHYAPKTTFVLTQNIDETITAYASKKIGLMLFSAISNYDSTFSMEILSPSGNFKEAAQNLYAAMHRLDQLNLDVIIAERFPDQDLGKTMNDRLFRATYK